MDDLRSDDTKAVDAAIAKAVLAEREACAKIAETVQSGPVYMVDGRPNAGAVMGGEHIAAAIRGQPAGQCSG